MSKLILRRLVAFCLDYTIIAIYALLLFGISKVMNLEKMTSTPISGQLLGFVSLTLPVFLYFFLTEKSESRATIGKRVMNISIRSKTENAEKRILLRNILKFLPWEIAHTGVHCVVFFSKSQNIVPFWIWILLILPQLITIAYLFSIVISKGESSIYDSISKTKVKINPSKTAII
jgi:hypothetical protein